eukprot:TRINITY_DN2831_c0_g1_i1.p1 TRINITY_DN2831_c0_g1~~TRINITY_DN2831_c0_g1_i1.p1  ORF type:complete len:736 (-),score=76.56 TRINITY_DN2831_c0_g1_i1:33-2240(-)
MKQLLDQATGTNAGLDPERDQRRIEALKEEIKSKVAKVEELFDGLSFYKPQKDHPFYDAITAAEIPVTTWKGEASPDLLLHQLQTLQGEARRIIELINKFAPSESYKIMTILGVSGCSKTKNIYRTLAKRFGMYFTCTNKGNGGSGDFGQMLTDLVEITSKESDPTKLEQMGSHYFSALLLARLWVAEELITRLTPYQWLVLQVRSPQLLHVEGMVRDLFTYLYREIKQLESTIVEKEVERSVGALYTLGKEVVIVVDEAQLLMDSCKNKFLSKSNQRLERSAFSKMVDVWGRHQENILVLTGTGVRMQDAVYLSASAALKPIGELEKFKYTDFGGYYSQKEFIDYMKGFFGDANERVLEELYEKYKGRYRIASELVRRVCISNMPVAGTQLLHSVSEEYWKWATTNLDQTAPRGIIEGLNSKFKADESFLLMENLWNLTVSYHLCGGARYFTDKRYLTLSEQGICPLKKVEDGRLAVFMAEPLFAEAARLYFEKTLSKPLLGEFTKMMETTARTPAVSGRLFETYGLSKLVDFFNSKESIDLHLKKSPKWFKGAKLLGPLAEGKIQFIYENKTNTFTDFLARPRGAVFIHCNNARMEASFPIKLPSNQLILCTTQMKFRQYLSPKDFEAAVHTTDIMKIYSLKTNENVTQTNFINKREEVINAWEQNFDLKLVRVLLSYSAVNQQVVVEEERRCGDVFFVFSPQNNRAIFTGKEWEFLDYIKDVDFGEQDGEDK